jgi:hypothetical protein
MRLFAALILVLGALLSGCVHTPPKDLSKFETDKPSSILVVPPVNESVEVTAPEYLLSTITIPLAEKGYYVFPVNLVKRVLEDDGLSDSGMVHSADPLKVCNLFGADSVLYITIKEWHAQYLVLSTTVNVGLNYTIKSCKTGETLWDHYQKMVYTPQNSGGGIIGMLVAAAVANAVPNYIPLANQANTQAFYGKGVAIPSGPYAVAEVK